MSEYQIVSFRAVDRPLNDQQMKFMESQSSRAEFTKWDYKVEYKYSSFRGNVEGMLRNGYDIFHQLLRLWLHQRSNSPSSWPTCSKSDSETVPRKWHHLDGR